MLLSATAAAQRASWPPNHVGVAASSYNTSSPLAGACTPGRRSTECGACAVALPRFSRGWCFTRELLGVCFGHLPGLGECVQVYLCLWLLVHTASLPSKLLQSAEAVHRHTFRCGVQAPAAPRSALLASAVSLALVPRLSMCSCVCCVCALLERVSPSSCLC